MYMYVHTYWAVVACMQAATSLVHVHMYVIVWHYLFLPPPFWPSLTYCSRAATFFRNSSCCSLILAFSTPWRRCSSLPKAAWNWTRCSGVSSESLWRNNWDTEINQQNNNWPDPKFSGMVREGTKLDASPCSWAWTSESVSWFLTSSS